MATIAPRIRLLLKLPPVLSALGWRNLSRYARHRLRLRLGIYASRSRIGAWSQSQPPELNSIRNPFSPIDLVTVNHALHEREVACAIGDRIASREIPYFSKHWLPIPHSWRKNPQSGVESPSAHWSQIADFDERQGDIKWIWEPSRFDWVYSLARAFAASANDKYAEAFWVLFEDWRECNPPNNGVNWRCGQESSFKMFALAFAAAAFQHASPSTSERVGKLWQAFEQLAERVDVSIEYALSQRNNHGISEAAALYLAGTCLTQNPRAENWRRKGKHLFDLQILDQFFDDGAYIQHSFQYQRLALRVASIVCFVARFSKDEISPLVKQRLDVAIQFMARVVDPITGQTPNYGANDGSNIFALNGCGFLDFRPLLQTMSALVSNKRIYGRGPWDEELAWLAVESPLGDPVQLSSFEAITSGFYGLRDKNSFGLIRCHSFRTRPSHADMLALNIWIHGHEVVLDSGTYQYFDPKAIGSYLKGTAAHSTVEVNGHSQMTEGRRFLWLDWTKSKIIAFAPARGSFVGEHYGYLKSDDVTHRRTALLRDGDWLIIDDLVVATEKSVSLTLRWRLNREGNWTHLKDGARSTGWDMELRVQSSSRQKTTLVQGDLENVETLESPHYGELRAVDLVKSNVDSSTTFRWITTIGKCPLTPAGSEGFHWHDCVVRLEPLTPVCSL